MKELIDKIIKLLPNYLQPIDKFRKELTYDLLEQILEELPIFDEEELELFKTTNDTSILNEYIDVIINSPVDLVDTIITVEHFLILELYDSRIVQFDTLDELEKFAKATSVAFPMLKMYYNASNHAGFYCYKNINNPYKLITQPLGWEDKRFKEHKELQLNGSINKRIIKWNRSEPNYGE